MTVPATERPAPMPRRSHRDETDPVLRWAALAYIAAVLVHGGDHLRRGLDAVTAQVLWAGRLQFAVALVVVVLVLRGHRAAPAASALLGFTSAALFVVVHFLPGSGAFSDAFTGSHVGPGVTALSWVAAIVEVAAGVALGCAGLRAHARARAGAPAGARAGSRS